MIEYKQGNLFLSNCKVFCHQTNCKGAMGRGIAASIRSLYPRAYYDFLLRYQHGLAELGEIDFCCCWDNEFKDDRFIVNMYAQDNYYPVNRGLVFTDYNAFRKCCKRLKLEISRFWANNTSKIKIGFPSHIGCGLAGGDWVIVKQILEEEFSGPNWSVEIWEYNQ